MLKIDDIGISVVVIGGATRGGSGWGITPSGKIIKIPDNNPIAIVSELALLATRVSDSELQSEMEVVLGKALAQLDSR